MNILRNQPHNMSRFTELRQVFKAKTVDFNLTAVLCAFPGVEVHACHCEGIEMA